MIYHGILALSFTLNSRLLPPWLSKAQDSSEVQGGPKPDILPKNENSPKEAMQNKKGNDPNWKWGRETERDQN